MSIQTHSQLEARTQVIRALGHASRLQMVMALANGERCVCELRELVGADISTVSKHLSVLKHAGIVSDDKRGLQVFYRLRVPCILNFLSCVDAVLELDADGQTSATPCAATTPCRNA